MKQTWFRWATISLSILGFGWSVGHAARPSRSPTPQTAPLEGVPVVVELFTSEGCSSCPPADTLLANLEAQQPFANTQVIALEEHVDYWNADGWIDPFSSREWTLRQQEYAASLKSQNPYTPQVVVDGHTEMVGSHEGQVRESIEKAATQGKAHVSVSVAPSAKAGTEQATVSVDKLTAITRGDKADVWLAVTESGLHSAVSAGENAGSNLHHASIVRVLRKIASIDPNKEASYNGNATVHLESSWKRENVHIVVFVQEKRSRQILAANSARIQS
jgi:hypothetical protein